MFTFKPPELITLPPVVKLTFLPDLTRTPPLRIPPPPLDTEATPPAVPFPAFMFRSAPLVKLTDPLFCKSVLEDAPVCTIMPPEADPWPVEMDTPELASMSTSPDCMVAEAPVFIETAPPAEF